jgi:hypothetical protein
MEAKSQEKEFLLSIIASLCYIHTTQPGGSPMTQSTEEIPQQPIETEEQVEQTAPEQELKERNGFISWYGRARDYYRRSPRLRKAVYQKRFGPAFWTIASIFSLTINIILIVIIILLGRQLFNLKNMVTDQLINGLYDNFVLMDQANIKTTVNVSSTIQVQDEIPVVFDLPLSQDTEVVLVNDTPIEGATIFLNWVAVPLDIILPAGTPLNINLDLVVPVSQTIPVVLNVPVNLTVPVDIPLNQTELHEPFTGLQGVVAPYRSLLSNTPNSWNQIPVCKTWWAGWLCNLLLGSE